jgi:predicted regulator of amino acid metabolism with ACT domain
MAWHSYVVAQQPGTKFFKFHLRNAAIECMNRLGKHVSNGKSWAEAVELRKTELAEADGA